MAAAWVSGNTRASAVFRPGQQAVVEGLQGEQVEAVEEAAPTERCRSA